MFILLFSMKILSLSFTQKNFAYPLYHKRILFIFVFSMKDFCLSFSSLFYFLSLQKRFCPSLFRKEIFCIFLFLFEIEVVECHLDKRATRAYFVGILKGMREKNWWRVIIIKANFALTISNTVSIDLIFDEDQIEKCFTFFRTFFYCLPRWHVSQIYFYAFLNFSIKYSLNLSFTFL